MVDIFSIRLDELRPKVAAIGVQPMVGPVASLAMPVMLAVLQNLYSMPPLAMTALNDWLPGVLLLVLRLFVVCKAKQNHLINENRNTMLSSFIQQLSSFIIY